MQGNENNHHHAHDDEPLLLLNGPTGTRLIERGFKPHPVLWTARAALDAPTLLQSIHAEYVAAGANIITAHTFGASPYRVRKAGLSELEGRKMVHTAVMLATEAVENSKARQPVFVAGSMGPVEDCYQPNLAPDDATLEASHGLMAKWLAAACDVVLVQTMATSREALIALRAALEGGIESVFVGFITDESGTRLLDGEPLLEAAGRCAAEGATGVTVNCVHADVVDKALARLAPLAGEGVLLGAYANSSKMTFDAKGEPHWASDPRPEAERAREYAVRAERWVREYGARLVGSCCGTTAAYTRELSARLAGQG